MADNLTVSIGIDSSKVQADIAVLKAKLSEATKEMNKLGREAAKTGDMSKVLEASKNVDALTRSLRANQAELRGVGIAAAGAARGLHATTVASAELAETSGRTSKEVFTLSRDLGKLEISSTGAAKAFREFPKIAIPIAVIGGAIAAVSKLANEGYKAVTALDDLSKASGFAGVNIVALEKTFGKADVGFDVLEKMLRSVGESFDKAKVKAGDFGSMVSGVQTMRGGAGGGGSGIQVLRGGPVGPGGQPLSTIEGGGTTVFRGSGALNIDPSKGFAGLVDPNQFKTQEEFFAAARRALLNIQSEILQREVLRGQGLDPVATLRGLRASSAADFARTRESALSDPRLQPGAVPLAREFGAQREEAGAAREGLMTEGGIAAMQAAIPALKGVQEGFEKLSEQIRKTREDADQTMTAITKGVDSGELGAATESFGAAWTGTFQNIQQSWQSTVDYINSHQPTIPMGTGTIPPAAPYATGGTVPGSGTGDTVPAMLTPGEYVARRASVDYYGSGVFSALNNRAIPRDLFSRFGFAVGGLVGDRLNFADGGMVPAGGGTPVHLHLDGQQFVMSASDHVASALVTASQRYQMRSAGVKPSWYGGRPGG
jgi:hypothetical protein